MAEEVSVCLVGDGKMRLPGPTSPADVRAQFTALAAARGTPPPMQTVDGHPRNRGRHDSVYRYPITTKVEKQVLFRVKVREQHAMLSCDDPICASPSDTNPLTARAYSPYVLETGASHLSQLNMPSASRSPLIRVQQSAKLRTNASCFRPPPSVA